MTPEEHLLKIKELEYQVKVLDKQIKCNEEELLRKTGWDKIEGYYYVWTRNGISMTQHIALQTVTKELEHNV